MQRDKCQEFEDAPQQTTLHTTKGDAIPTAAGNPSQPSQPSGKSISETCAWKL